MTLPDVTRQFRAMHIFLTEDTPLETTRIALEKAGYKAIFDTKQERTILLQ